MSVHTIDSKNAYEILGLKEGAGKDEIRRRYDVLLKRTQMPGRPDSDGSAGAAVDFDTITKAYNILMGYTTVSSEDKAPEKPNPVFEKLGIDKKKVQNFFYYHKIHIIIAIIAVILVTTTIKEIVERGNPDLNITFIGEFACSDFKAVEKQIKEKVPGIIQPNVEINTISDKVDNDIAVAMQNKTRIDFVAGISDIYILDRNTFAVYSQWGAFMNLDQLGKDLNIDRDKNKDYILKIKDDKEAHLYGIDIGSSSVLKSSYLAGDERILAIRVNAKHYEKAVEFVKSLLK